MNPLTSNNPSMDSNYYWDLLMKGNRQGLEGLYKEYIVTLFNYGIALSKDENFIQDCIQEVFIDLWKYHKSLGKAVHVKAYLLRALSHKIFRENQQKTKLLTVEWKDGIDNTIVVESIESELIDIQREKGLQIKLANALDKIPLRQKQAIHLLFFEQLSYEEVSKLMGINLRSVYTIAWKAIANLKKHIVSGISILVFLTLLQFY
ncbi:RNA polymerase sigma factor [Cyclobacterium amurskyense]|jgi:RNA polymerase sigma factor (sigma-70 family)|uniref:RNA polymerase ECF-type sigma factor n=1 Tax=Cyclobacterium amurskyense TaxID=320787 RepID=A0A0H4PG45_9BACT|nr:sigma-70 family RNA polymerase sigma factor [Cyclobacterium amurskyense]AKP53199.1 RNA polymerase ECF-type sigma factor [Cyclobacterium amurskyense]|tara:strand:+ start:7375 stop:7989 length:615 start_codon:yes stop_codon:yes gene_type:complete